MRWLQHCDTPTCWVTSCIRSTRCGMWNALVTALRYVSLCRDPCMQSIRRRNRLFRLIPKFNCRTNIVQKITHRREQNPTQEQKITHHNQFTKKTLQTKNTSRPTVSRGRPSAGGKCAKNLTLPGAKPHTRAKNHISQPMSKKKHSKKTHMPKPICRIARALSNHTGLRRYDVKRMVSGIGTKYYNSGTVITQL